MPQLKTVGPISFSLNAGK